MWLGTPLLSVPPGMVLIMFDGLHDIDWASMEHAYGSAEEVPALLTALRSPDAGERHKALDRFYGAVHHAAGPRTGAVRSPEAPPRWGCELMRWNKLERSGGGGLRSSTPLGAGRRDSAPCRPCGRR